MKHDESEIKNAWNKTWIAALAGGIRKDLHIPVQPKDPDAIIGDALQELFELRIELEKLRANQTLLMEVANHRLNRLVDHGILPEQLRHLDDKDDNENGKS